MEEKEKCMACECPCSEHTEHNHPLHEGMEHKEYIKQGTTGMTCRHCGHNHRADTECEVCGCKVK